MNHAQALAAAIDADTRRRFVRDTPSYAGYSWYPARRLGAPHVTACTKDGFHRLAMTADPGASGDPQAPPSDPVVEEIHLAAAITIGDDVVESLTGTLPAFAAEADDLDHTAWWAVPGQPGAVYDILWNSTFWYNDDADGDSYDTQSDRYRRFLLELLARTFDGPIASYALAVKEAIAELWLSPLSPASIVIELSGNVVERVRFLNADGSEITEPPAQAR